MKSKIKVIAAVLLAVVILISAMGMSILSVFAESSVSLSYDFIYNNSGYAEGKVTLTASESQYGMYYLYWADDTKALSGYREIATLNVTTGSKSFVFGEFTAIPAGATKLIAIKSSTEPATKTVANASAVYELPKNKIFKYSQSEREYTFQALSDVHIDKQPEPYYIYADQHFAGALEAAADRNVDFVVITGDMINNNHARTTKDWQVYQQIIADSSYCNPIYESNGNHEMKTEVEYGHDSFITATGLNTTTSLTGNLPYYEVTAQNGDHLIFMALETDSSPNESDEFTTAQLDWFEGLLAKYKNDGKNIFVLEHALFSGYGAGDNKEIPFYGGSLQSTYPSTQRLKGILESNPDVMFLSGHTHIAFEFGYNIDNENGSTAYTIHIPSTACPTHIVNGALDYTMYEDRSQGYFVDVYDDYVIYNGTDLCENEIYPAYTYMIDNSGEPLDKTDFDNSQIVDTVEVTVDINGCVDAPSKVYCYTYDDDAQSLKSYPGTVMTKNSDGTYTANVPADENNMCFVFYNSTYGGFVSKEYKTANCKVKIGVEKVTYTNSSGWANVYAYMWSDSTTSVTWPGVKMQKDSSGKYFTYIPEDKYTMVIFSDGADGKTDDLSISGYVSDYSSGSYEVIEKPTQPTVTPTEKPTEAPTTVEGYMVGDADVSGAVNIRDTSAIQKHVARMSTLSDIGKINADVNIDGYVDILDATYIQKYVAKIISSFPSQKSKTLVSTGATSSTLSTLLANVKTVLYDDYRYSSYDAYMTLKKAYYQYKDVSVSSLSQTQIDTAYSTVNNALTQFNALKSSNKIVTVYFTDNHNWGTPRAYVWNGSKYIRAWDGSAMTYMRTNSSSQNIYAITLNQSKWPNVIFTRDGKQTVDVDVPVENHVGYYLSGSQTEGKYDVKTYEYTYDRKDINN